MRMNILVLFLISEEMLSAFYHWVWYYLWVCHTWLSLCWGILSLCLLSGVFNHKLMLNFDKIGMILNFDKIRMDMWFLLFSLLLWYMISIYLWILKKFYIPGIDPTWLWHMILLMYFWIGFANIFLRIFASIFISDIGL